MANPTVGIANSQIMTEDRFKQRAEMSSIWVRASLKVSALFQPERLHRVLRPKPRLLGSDELEVFDSSGEKDRQKYGMNNLGQGCLRLPSRCAGVQVIEVHNGGWDMHNGIQTASLHDCPRLIRRLPLISDLDQRGFA